MSIRASTETQQEMVIKKLCPANHNAESKTPLIFVIPTLCLLIKQLCSHGDVLSVLWRNPEARSRLMRASFEHWFL